MKLDDIAMEVAQTITASGCITSSRDLTIFTKRFIARLEQEGWRVVPVEPTEKTYAACHNERMAQFYWRALIAAAPRIEKEH